MAAHALEDLTGCDRYAEAADRYVADFLSRCVASNGLFLWGNHYFYDAAKGSVVWFGGGDRAPVSIDPEVETGAYHETRPLPVAWGLFCMNTSETGMWAGSLMRCFELSGEEAFADMAVEALGCWLDRAWCEDAGQFYGKLRIRDATPVLEPKTTLYQPGDYCDPWEPLFPAHDYPMPNAEACLKCYRHTGEERFLRGVERWIQVLSSTLPARNGRGGYAEHYGRSVHFLVNAAESCDRPAWRDLAHQIVAEALDRLVRDGRFRTHPGEDRCDAVDGLGFLFLALMYLETGTEPDLMGLGF